MAFLNSRGQALHGVGGGHVSIDNAPLIGTAGHIRTIGGGAMGWKDDDHVVFATQLSDKPAGWPEPDGLAVVVVKVSTKQIVDMVPRHATFGHANGGVWAALFPGDPVRGKARYGLFSSTGFEGYAFSPIAVGPQGEIAYTNAVTHDGVIRIRETNGQDYPIHSGPLYGLQILGNRRFIAQTPDMKALGIGFPTPLTVSEPIRTPKVFEVNGKLWVIYSATSRAEVITHPVDSLEGYSVVNFGALWAQNSRWGAYGVAARQVGDKIKIVWGVMEGEQPGELQVKEIPLSTPRVNLGVVQQPQPQPQPEPQPQPMPDTTTLLAPNMKREVERIINANKHRVNINIDVDEVRGKMVDIVATELNAGATKPWGRKARNRDGSRKNGDSLTYLRPDGRFEIYDIIANGGPSWQKPTKSLAQGENGYWAPADPVPTEPEPPVIEPPVTEEPPPSEEDEEVPGPQFPDLVELLAQIASAHAAVEEIRAQLARGFEASTNRLPLLGTIRFDITPKK